MPQGVPPSRFVSAIGASLWASATSAASAALAAAACSGGSSPEMASPDSSTAAGGIHGPDGGASADVSAEAAAASVPSAVAFVWDGGSSDAACSVIECVHAAAFLCPYVGTFGDCTDAGGRICLPGGAQVTFDTNIYTVWNNYGRTRCQSLSNEQSATVIRDGTGAVVASLALSVDGGNLEYVANCGGRTEQNSQSSSCWSWTGIMTQFICFADAGDYCNP
jgi:hypothetical protein